MKALIYKSTGSWYIAKTEDGQIYNTRIKGIFKIDEITSTNPVAVGDFVEIDFEDVQEKTAIIREIYERNNYIARSSPHNKMQHHIVSSNLDQALIFATLKDPKTSPGFIDRFLIAAEAYHVPAIIVFNKADLYRKKEMDKFEELSQTYTSCGYQVFLASLKEGEIAEDIKEVLKDKTTLLSGHSGVGKSTFLNSIIPGKDLRTQEVSGWSGKGMHTTTFAEMFDLPFGGRVIDTPGIREFGIIGISKRELSHYFPEMRVLINNCQFNNCVHINEPGCAVKESVNIGGVAIDRYVSYLNILDTINDTSY